MLASMYSGISGMKNFQQKLDVTGNNLANVNTFGFKKGRATFKDMVSQQIQGPTAAQDGGMGGSNPSQVGLGAQMGSIDTVQTQGSLQNTNRDLDLGISGDGFFKVGDGDEGEHYTRAGNFYLDDQGDLVNSDGYYVLDEDDNSISIDEEAESFSIGSNGDVNMTLPDGTETAGTISLTSFSNPGGLEKNGSNLFNVSVNSGDPETGAPGENGTGNLVAGTLEMSNVDMSEEFTEMITAQRGFQANTRGITTADEVLQEIMNLKR
ncbi:flagellar basal body rod protein FlgG [Salibacterium salarium]|uniref:Flagellar basal body rod protein FlgG n=1 Tax=Salibacterium salarium TaxID=284579 RepID=A0A3R9PL25_9BACI|nr:flagellar basal body rod protein FlgG [Salibacterium salarium]RSL33173.1 flagellar basal body rod protein FlgG [Salibacterium salarium]